MGDRLVRAVFVNYIITSSPHFSNFFHGASNVFIFTNIGLEYISVDFFSKLFWSPCQRIVKAVKVFSPNLQALKSVKIIPSIEDEEIRPIFSKLLFVYLGNNQNESSKI
jgi:hypothetical protein